MKKMSFEKMGAVMVPVAGLATLVIDAVLAHDTIVQALRNDVIAMAVAFAVAVSIWLCSHHAAKAWDGGSRWGALGLLGASGAVIAFMFALRCLFGFQVTDAGAFGGLVDTSASQARGVSGNATVAGTMAVIMMVTAAATFATELGRLSATRKAKIAKCKSELLEINSELAARESNGDVFDPEARLEAAEAEHDAKRQQIASIFADMKNQVDTYMLSKMGSEDAEEYMYDLGIVIDRSGMSEAGA